METPEQPDQPPPAYDPWKAPDADHALGASGPSSAIPWILVAAAVITVTIYQNFMTHETPAATPTASWMVEIPAKVLIGAESMAPGNQEAPLEELDVGSLEQRQQVVVLAHELLGNEVASLHLARIDDDLVASEFAMSDEQLRVHNALHQLYDAGDVPAVDAVSESDQQLIRSRLGWLGKLALAPKGGANSDTRAALLREAETTAVVLTSGVLGGLLAAGLGFLGLLGLAFAVYVGYIQPKLTVPGELHRAYHIQTFACWFILFLVLQVLASWSGVRGGVVAAFFLSLLALGYPALRGQSTGALFRDIGLGQFRSVIVDLLLVPVGYCLTLPIAAAGLLLTLIFFAIAQGFNSAAAPLFESIDAPSHPVVHMFGEHGYWGVILMAAVAAPIVEEIAFRGLLFRHLREGLRESERDAPRPRKLRRGLTSFLFSTFVSSLIFAMIHPQGLLAIPALMGIAGGLCLARECRNSLVTSIGIHSLHNGALVTAMYFALAR